MRDIDAFVALLTRHLNTHLERCVEELITGSVRNMEDYRELTSRVALLREISQHAIPHAQRVYYGQEEEQ